MSTKNQKYQINEKDIDTVLNILKRVDPERATPEMAIDILEYYQASVHSIKDHDPEMLVKIFEELENEKAQKQN